MERLETISQLKHWRSVQKGSIAFVPTMGFLHEGHLSLIRLAQKKASTVIVSIFVNPAQFNNATDLEKYPVDLNRDLTLLKEEKVDAVFTPNKNEIYPNGVPQIILSYPNLMNKLCGIQRPGHFEGVLLIVHNLLLWIRPDFAIFGEKDFQQLLLVKRMVADLTLETTIVAAPLIRQGDDGIALSSRNANLSKNGYQTALSISKALFSTQKEYENLGKIINQEIIDSLLRLCKTKLIEGGILPEKIEYIQIYNSKNLTPPILPPSFETQKPKRTQEIRLFIAAEVEKVRLIDNIKLFSSTSP